MSKARITCPKNPPNMASAAYRIAFTHQLTHQEVKSSTIEPYLSVREGPASPENQTLGSSVARACPLLYFAATLPAASALVT